jgi:TusA-related sulfurtransferase
MESFDLRDTIIPFYLLQIANYFQQMKVGEEIEILANDAGVARDLKSILPASEVTIHAVAARKDDSPKFRWRLKKKVPLPSDKKGGASCLKSI